MNNIGSKQSWHLDKRVPITGIVVIVMQVIAFTWAGALMYSQIQHNTEALVRVNEELTDQKRIIAPTAADLSGLRATQVLILEQGRQTNVALINLNARIDTVIERSK